MRFKNVLKRARAIDPLKAFEEGRLAVEVDLGKAPEFVNLIQG